MERLRREFFARPTLEVARELLGKRLVRSFSRRGRSPAPIAGGRIVEVEAYIGEEDTACHAASGRTARNAVMYGAPGKAYVYFTYGMHWMLNVVTEPEGFPAAVLLRAIEPELGLDILQANRPGRSLRDLTSGPARLSSALGIDRQLNGTDLVAGEELYIVEGDGVSPGEIEATPRIGIDYAEARHRDALWRFIVRTSTHISRSRSALKRRVGSGGRGRASYNRKS